MQGRHLDSIAISNLKGVGPALQGKLEQIGLSSVQDLLFHLPYRYEDRTRLTPCGSVQPFQNAVIEAEILAADVMFGKRRSLVCKISDGTGILNLRFFHFSNAQKAQFAKGSTIRCYGEARKGSMGLEIYHPEYRIFQGSVPELDETLTPYYHLTSGISQQKMRYLLQQSLALLEKGELEEYLPDSIIKAYRFPALNDTLSFIHNPPRGVDVEELVSGQHLAWQRLCMEELAAQQLGFIKVRNQLQTQKASILQPDPAAQENFIASLPFKPTGAQQRVFQQISEDLQ